VPSPGLCIDTACDAGIGDEVKFVADQQHRRCLGGAFGEPPYHMSVGDITLPVRPNRYDLGTVEGRADEKQSVPEHRARHNGITFSVADAPEFASVFGVISVHGSAAGTDYLAAPMGVDQKRRGERKLLLG